MIREFDSRDRPAIRIMADQTVRDGTVFPFESIDGVLGYWFSPGSRCFVFESAGTITGSYVIKPNLPDRCAHIANAGYMVHEQFRGQGIGRALGEHSLETARQLGYRAMQFNVVVASNASAVRLWKQLGFRTLAHVPDAFRLPDGKLVDLLIMHRTLPSD